MSRFWNFREASIVKKIMMVLGGILMAGVLALLFGFILLWLWNWIMPDIFGLPEITYWQAWGLALLAHILFKGGNSGSGSRSKKDHSWKNRMRQKYDHRDEGDEGDEGHEGHEQNET